MKEILQSIRQHLSERISSPFYGPFVIAWLGWNHRYLFILASDGPIEWRFQLGNELIYTTTLQTWWYALIGPAISSVVFILVAPWLNRGLFAYTYWIKLKQKADRDKIDKHQALTIEESKYVMAQAISAQKESHDAEATITKLNREVQILRTKLDAGGQRIQSPTVPTTAQQSGGLPVPAVPPSAPTIVSNPGSQFVLAGKAASFWVEAQSDLPCTYQWTHNGTTLDGAGERQLLVPNAAPKHAGIYNVEVTNEAGTVVSKPAVLGIIINEHVVGSAKLVSEAVTAPNGNIYDFVLLTGDSASVTATPGRITRVVFIDPNDDIVNVEFSGAGTLTIVVDSPSGPAAPLGYNQPSVSYMKGLAGLTIVAADESTNLAIYASGKATTVDPTDRFDFQREPDAANKPSDTGSSLFVGRGAVHRDGHADLSYIAAFGTKFGGLRAANVRFSAARGITGLFAKSIHFTGPVAIGDIEASGSAIPVLMMGAASDVRIAGGDLKQANDKPVEVGGMALVKFTDGSDADGNVSPAQKNQARFVERGRDVTHRLILPEHRQ